LVARSALARSGGQGTGGPSDRGSNLLQGNVTGVLLQIGKPLPTPVGRRDIDVQTFIQGSEQRLFGLLKRTPFILGGEFCVQHSLHLLDLVYQPMRLLQGVGHSPGITAQPHLPGPSQITE
jgi:hypothetical protein